jgi:hypothetical protein
MNRVAIGRLTVALGLLLSPVWAWPDPPPEQTITTDATHQFVHGHRLRLVVNASRCDLTLDGSVESVVVNGNHNQVFLKTRAGQVVLHGDHNTLIYSPLVNPVGPNVEDDGNDNTVRAASKP